MSPRSFTSYIELRPREQRKQVLLVNSVPDMVLTWESVPRSTKSPRSKSTSANSVVNTDSRELLLVSGTARSVTRHKLVVHGHWTPLLLLQSDPQSDVCVKPNKRHHKIISKLPKNVVQQVFISVQLNHTADWHSLHTVWLGLPSIEPLWGTR